MQTVINENLLSDMLCLLNCDKVIALELKKKLSCLLFPSLEDMKGLDPGGFGGVGGVEYVGRQLKYALKITNLPF